MCLRVIRLSACGAIFCHNRDTFGSVESVKAASDVYSPVAGEVLEINDVRKEEIGIHVTCVNTAT